jgi:hypothetical protein
MYANTTADNNTALGSSALRANTTGHSNVAVGTSAGADLTTGEHNVLIGKMTGSYDGTDLTTGSQNVLVGNFTKVSAADSANQIVLGYYVTSAGDNTVTFGNGATDLECGFGDTNWSNPSDVRYKEDIQDETVGLGFINDLRPVTFQWKKEKDVPEDHRSYVADSDKRVMNGKHNHGFIAQEVKEVINKYDLKEGFGMWTQDEIEDRQRVAPSAAIPIMIKAIQELSAELNELKDKVENK